MLRRGSEADVRALALAVALSQRATHPVSRALTSLGAALGPALPLLHIQDFYAVSGAHFITLCKCAWLPPAIAQKSCASVVLVTCSSLCMLMG